jgi:F420-non-reducing hydrogenase iron-sulfur subunit
MCSGRVESAYILKAFQTGVDGVLVTGCHIGDCHYQAGNEKAEKRIAITKDLIKILGINKERLRLEWISASEGARFAEVIKEFSATLNDLPQTPFKEDET